MNYFDFGAMKKILVVRLSSIGDIVHALPVASVLRTNFPRAEIDWITEEPAFNLLATNKFLDKVLVFPRYNWRGLLKKRAFNKVWREFKSFSRQLRSFNYDLVFDFHDILRSGLVTGLTRAPQRWGYGTQEGNKYFLTDKFFPVDPGLHTTEKHLRVLKDIGLPKSVVDFGFKAMGKPDFLKTEQPFVILHPFSRWQTKNWPLANYLTVGRKLADQGFHVYFSGSRADAGFIEGAVERESGITSLAGRTTLEEFIALVQKASLFIGGDTGPMHIAAANCPVVAIMGPTSAQKYGPYGQENNVVKADLDCLGCDRRHCFHHLCMKNITPKMVLDVAEQIFKKGGARRLFAKN